MAPPIPADGRILFFARDRVEFGFLSHFHPAPFVLDGEHWPTVEHYYHTQKSLEPTYRRAIRACETPGHAKRLAANPNSTSKEGRNSWFTKHGKTPRADWFEVKRDVMRRADTAKYAQNPELAECLLGTADAEIVEDAKHDAFWGIGRDGAGENWAGRILMEVREVLRMATHVASPIDPDSLSPSLKEGVIFRDTHD